MGEGGAEPVRTSSKFSGARAKPGRFRGGQSLNVMALAANASRVVGTSSAPPGARTPARKVRARAQPRPTWL